MTGGGAAVASPGGSDGHDGGDMVEDTAVDEYDTLAAWTAEALTDLSPSHAVPGACRGSANPAALAWLAEALEITPTTRVLDTGGGLGGPAAWLAERYGARPVVCEPMLRAAQWGRHLFALPSVAASAQGLPFAHGSFDAAWALGVLSTVGDKRAVLDEARRVLTPSGRLGLLEYVATSTPVPDPPSGNEFLSADAITGLLDDHGFVVVTTVDGARLPAAPLAWQARISQVKAAVARAHPASPVLERADAQERRFAELLADGHLSTFLVHAVATG